MVNPAVQDLGKQPSLPTLLSLLPTNSQEKQDIAEQSPIKMGLTYCTIQSPLSLPQRLSLSAPPPHPSFLSPLSPLFVSSANRPRGRISAVSQVPALALWEGRALVNGGVGGGGGREGKGMCVLGKQGFVGCDCLIPGGLSFHSSSHLIPHHAGVVRAAASPSSGTRLASPSPRASRTANARPACRHTERRQCLRRRPSSRTHLARLLLSHRV